MLQQMQKFTGRRCPRVEPFCGGPVPNIDVIACAHELRTLAESPAACDDAYRSHTEGMTDEHRREFRRKLALYRNELERLLRENAAARQD